MFRSLGLGFGFLGGSGPVGLRQSKQGSRANVSGDCFPNENRHKLTPKGSFGCFSVYPILLGFRTQWGLNRMQER